MRVLSFDPGSRNMGVSVVECNNKVRIIMNTTLEHPICDIKSINEQKREFLKEIRKLIRVYKPDWIAAERFQSRGLRGKTVECVNIMLGILLCCNKPLFLTTAANWKNKYQKRFKMVLKEVYKTIYITPHQLDSCLIGLYALENILNREIRFRITSTVDSLEKTSLIGIKVR